MTSSPTARTSWSREHWLLASMCVCLGTFVIAIIPGFASAMREPAATPRSTLSLALPPLSSSRGLAQSNWDIVRIESGQTLGSLFAERGWSPALLQQFMDHPGAKAPLSRLRAGSEIAFRLAADGALQALRFDRDEAHRVELQLAADGIEETVIERTIERRVVVATGEITSSLYAAGARAGLGPSAIHQMANAFSYDIDFTQDLRDGDRFQVVYEEIWRDGERLRGGDVIGASFVNRGTEYTAFRFERNGKYEFFDASGRPLKKSFMRMPIEFARISSGFGARRHPVLGRMRMHNGVDYAAGTGTPIMAAGDGRIAFAGWKGGYGRTVIVDHGRGHTTLYGHMSRLGNYRVGQPVSQGATIGYVGSTGLATGPHLHYEFRVNGVHKNPLSVTMPRPEPLTGAELLAFRAATAPVLAKLELIEGARFATAP